MGKLILSIMLNVGAFDVSAPTHIEWEMSASFVDSEDIIRQSSDRTEHECFARLDNYFAVLQSADPVKRIEWVGICNPVRVAGPSIKAHR